MGSIRHDFCQEIHEVMDMNNPSQPQRDRILWILTNSGGKMDRSRLRRCAGMRYAQLDPLHKELADEGRIGIPAIW